GTPPGGDEIAHRGCLATARVPVPDDAHRYPRDDSYTGEVVTGALAHRISSAGHLQRLLLAAAIECIRSRNGLTRDRFPDPPFPRAPGQMGQKVPASVLPLVKGGIGGLPRVLARAQSA